ncbi:MAG: TetR/AcrR family transcriptional regulator [Candidatus Acidiferrales bacterium]
MFKNEVSTEKGEQTRRAIFDAALKLFRERGFDATTMRDIAASAGLALGAAYYYFPSKEAIIQAYYEVVQAEHGRRVDEALAEKKGDLRERVRFAMNSKLDILQNDRKLLGVVFRYTGEPEHPLSCLGPATERVRRESIEVFSRAIGDERLPADLRQLLPVALWALQMGALILFIYDDSPGQRRTRRLVDGAVDLTVRLLGLTRNPILKPVRVKVLDLLRDVELIPEFEIGGEEG